jgi:adenylate cyclase
MSRRGGSAASGRRERRKIVFLGAGLALAFAGLHLARPDLLVSLDRRIYDAYVAEATSRRPAEGVVVVGLDEAALARFGQWPWPRELVARLLEGIQALGARSVAIDALFPEPERVPQPAVPPGGLTPGDARLAQVLSQGPFVLGYAFAFGDGSPPSACPPHPLRASWHAASGAADRGMPLFGASGTIGNLEALWRAAPGSGFLNATPDGDGLLRRLPLLISCGERVYPSLALAAWLLPRAEESAVLRTGAAGAEELRVGDRTIPLDARGNLLLGFYGGRPVPRVSAAQVLDGTAPASALEGRVVFVGATAAGLERGLATPAHPALRGVEVHAAAAADLISGRFVHRPPFAPALELVAVLAAGLGVALLFVFAPVGWAAAGAGAGALALWLGASALFRTWGAFVSPLGPLLSLAGATAVLAVARSLGEERRARSRGEDLRITQGLALESLSALAESRSHGSRQHALRTQRYTRALCDRLARHPRYRAALDEATVELVANLAPIHDIGKAQIPDGLLLKSGALSDAERAMLRKHALYGRETLERAAAGAPGDRGDFVGIAKDVVYSHHERWDGAGYPEGLAGEEIPLAGRVVAVVDVYDALVSARAYRRPHTHDQAVEIIAQGRGTHFDPAVVDAFLAVAEQWRELGAELAESPEEAARFRAPGKSTPKG